MGTDWRLRGQRRTEAHPKRRYVAKQRHLSSDVPLQRVEEGLGQMVKVGADERTLRDDSVLADKDKPFLHHS